MPIVKDEAQVLRVFEQGNTSQVLVLLGRRLGQMRVLAKGSRRFHRKGFEVVADAAIEADEYRAADERMANRDFVEMREAPEQD